MDPISALSLAVNILDVVQAATNLVSSTRQISNLDAREDHAELEFLTRDFEGWVLRVTPPKGRDSGLWTPEERSLQSLGSQCQKIIAELLEVLDTLKVQNRDAASRRVESFYRALLGLWKEEKINNLKMRLNAIADSIQRQLSSFELKRITWMLINLDAKRSKEVEALQEAIGQEESEDEKLTLLRQAAAIGSRSSAEQMVLGQLYFDEIDTRQKAIAPRYNSTLSWLFGTNTEPSPTDFNEWLASDEDLYWIAGKPGSGKSTLMRFLCDCDQTKTRLSVWTERTGAQLVQAEYFFWSSGDPLQKSKEGLLRSLLFKVLSQCPDLIQHAYPKTWRLYFPDDVDTAYGLTWRRDSSATILLSVSELLASLQSICDESAKRDINLCFFIDGLDEYDGQPKHLIELMRGLWGRTNIKICLSSREWNEFNEEYGRGRESPRMLLMQDYNQPDIHDYIQQKLQKNKTYATLEDDDNSRESFVNEVTEAANGVFFWVYLVMISFDDGLINGKFDSVDDMKEELNKIPKDLNEYFRRIVLRDIADDSHEQAAQMLSIAMVASGSLSFMAYWLADQGRKKAEYAFKLKASPISAKILAGRYVRMDQRLQACCKGLLEMHHEPLEAGSNELPCSMFFSHKVDFLHRTVREFLQLSHTQETLMGWTSAPFDPHEEICKALIAQIKIAPADIEYWGPVWKLYENFNRHIVCLLSKSDTRSPVVSRLRVGVEEALNKWKVAGKPSLGADVVMLVGTKRRDKFGKWFRKVWK